MQLFDTYSQAVKEFAPGHRPVRLYVCGITPYDTTHLGHAFTYVFFDVLTRYLEFRGHPVRYVQNVTDIDDDILRRARELRIPWDVLGQEQTERYAEDMAALNVRPPAAYPRATETIPKILEMVKGLLIKGFAYQAGGNVYFRVQADPDYGALSHLPPEEMLPIADERGNDSTDAHKLNPLDFVLWQAAKPGEPSWESPFGRGRPGWHIECSAMSLKYLGDTVDIHGGGADLVFPHHESEIAQSENYTGKRPFVRYWVHTGMVRLGGQKMSKSLGNLIMVRGLLRTYSPNAIRLYLLSHHYRETWNHDEAELRAMEEQVGRITQALLVTPRGETATTLDVAAWQNAFLSAMDDDLNTPEAIKVILDLAGKILESSARGENVEDAQRSLGELLSVLGFVLPQIAKEEESAAIEGWRRLVEPRAQYPSTP